MEAEAIFHIDQWFLKLSHAFSQHIIEKKIISYLKFKNYKWMS